MLLLPRTTQKKINQTYTMENLCMNTNAGLLPCGFEIEDINVAQKYSDLCEATCKNIMGYSPYELTIDSEEFLEFQILADKLLDII